MNDCKYCSKIGNCLRHEGPKWQRRFLYPCIGESCENYTKRKKRAQYRRGAKEYLSSFSVGEVREWDGYFPWSSLRSTACLLKRDFGCKFKFASELGTNKKTITRLV